MLCFDLVRALLAFSLIEQRTLWRGLSLEQLIATTERCLWLSLALLCDWRRVSRATAFIQAVRLVLYLPGPVK